MPNTDKTFDSTENLDNLNQIFEHKLHKRKHLNNDSITDKNCNNNSVIIAQISSINENDNKDTTLSEDKQRVVFETNLNSNVPNQSIGADITVNNLSLNQSAGVTIGNNIKCVIKQYFPECETKNDDLKFEKNANSLSKKDTESGNTESLFKQITSKKILLLIGILVIFIIIIGIVLGITLKKNDYESQETNDDEIDKSNEKEDEIEDPGGKFVARTQWRAKSAKQPLLNTILPVEMVVICHSGIGKGAETQKVCETIIRSIQDYALESTEFADIPYNFLVCGDGNIYEGRGWYKQNAAYDDMRNISISIAFVGNYEEIYPKAKSLKATQDFIAEAGLNGKIKSNYKLYAHSTWTAIASPGVNLYNEIKNWKHFTTEK